MTFWWNKKKQIKVEQFFYLGTKNNWWNKTIKPSGTWTFVVSPFLQFYDDFDTKKPKSNKFNGGK